jgi:hypothetical protein
VPGVAPDDVEARGPEVHRNSYENGDAQDQYGPVSKNVVRFGFGRLRRSLPFRQRLA